MASAVSFWFYTLNLLVTTAYVVAFLRQLGHLDPDHPKTNSLASWLVAVLGWAFFDLAATQSALILGPEAGFQVRNLLSILIVAVSALSVDLLWAIHGGRTRKRRRWLLALFVVYYPLILIWPGRVHPHPLENRLGFPVIPGWTHYALGLVTVSLVLAFTIAIALQARREPRPLVRREKIMVAAGSAVSVTGACLNSLAFIWWPWLPLLDSLSMLPFAITAYWAITRYGQVVSPKHFAQAVTQALPQGLLHVKEGLVAWANPVLAALTGRESVEDLIGRPREEIFVPPGPWPGLESWSGRGVWRGEAGLLTAAGPTVPCLVSAALLESGWPEAGMILACTDLSHFQRLEREIRESERKYRAIYQNLVDVHFRWDLSGRLLEASPSLRTVTGYTPEELANGEVILKSPRDRQRHQQFLRQVQETGAVDGFEIGLRAKDGRQLWLSLRAQLVRDPQGRPQFVEGLATDVTQRKRELEELIAASTRLELLLSLAPVAIFTACPEPGLPLTFASPHLEVLLGSRPDQALNQPGFLWHQALEEDRQTTAGQALRVLELGRMALEFRMQAQDKAPRWLRAEMVLVRDAKGRAQEVVGCLYDVSDRRQGEEVLRHLAAGVAHNFNNVLMAIASHAQVAQALVVDGQTAGDQLTTPLSSIVQAAKDGGDMVRRLSRYVSGWAGQPRKPEAHNLASLVGAAVGLAQAACPPDKRGQVLLDLDPDLMVLGVRGELVEVFLNLAKNALEAMGRRGRLTIRSRARDQEAELSFSDQGPGISPQVLERLFLPFFSTKGVAGQGMGLASSRGIITAHGGRIRAESVPGQGTTFLVSLPLAPPERPPQPEPPTPGPAAPHQGRPERQVEILLVEDEVLVAMGLGRLLENAGHRVSHAANLAQALEHLRRRRPELVLCDLGLPDGSGWEVARWLREHFRPAPPLVLLTGWSEGQESARRPEDLPEPAWVLRKPVLRQELLAVVAQAARTISDAPAGPSGA
ncbi:MAG: PAS domain S-box protein [Desulfarculus sp.]|nr:PAS domain S-box protein [Desulfarculus sp.]